MGAAMFPSVGARGDIGYGTRHHLARESAQSRFACTADNPDGVDVQKRQAFPGFFLGDSHIDPRLLHFAGGVRGCTGAALPRYLREGYIR